MHQSSSLLKHELNRESRQKSAEQPPLNPLPRRLSLQTRRDDAGCKDDEKVAYGAYGDVDQSKGDALRQYTSPHGSNKLREDRKVEHGRLWIEHIAYEPHAVKAARRLCRDRSLERAKSATATHCTPREVKEITSAEETKRVVSDGNDEKEGGQTEGCREEMNRETCLDA